MLEIYRMCMGVPARLHLVHLVDSTIFGASICFSSFLLRTFIFLPLNAELCEQYFFTRLVIPVTSVSVPVSLFWLNPCFFGIKLSCPEG